MKSILTVLTISAAAFVGAGDSNAIWIQKTTEGVVYEIVGNLPMRLDLKSSSFRVRITNNTSKPVEAWISGFWPNHSWRVTSLKGVPIQPSEKGKKRLALFGSSDRDKNAKLIIGPGRKFEYATPRLLEDFDLKSSTQYRLQIVYSDVLDTHKIVLRTKPVVFLVPS